MTDPYRVLGVSPTATVAEAEGRYRQLLKDAHPDRHHTDGDEAVAAAEDRTRALNDAMAAIRRRGDDPWLRPDPDAAWNRPHRGPDDPPGQPMASQSGCEGDPGDTDPPPRLVECGVCDGVFADPAELIVHRSSAHPEVVAHEVGLTVRRSSMVRRVLVLVAVVVLFGALAIGLSGSGLSTGQRVTAGLLVWVAVIMFGYGRARRTGPRR